MVGGAMAKERVSTYSKKISYATDVHPNHKILVVVTLGGTTNSGMMSQILYIKA